METNILDAKHKTPRKPINGCENMNCKKLVAYEGTYIRHSYSELFRMNSAHC